MLRTSSSLLIFAILNIFKLLREQQRQYHNSLKPFRHNTIQNVSKFSHVETSYLEFFYCSRHSLLALLEASYQLFHNRNCFQSGVCIGMEESLFCSCIKLLHLSFVKAVIICLLVKQIYKIYLVVLSSPNNQKSQQLEFSLQQATHEPKFHGQGSQSLE